MRTTTLVALTLVYTGNAFGQAAHTHWEPYKNASTPPSVDQKLTDPVLDGAIDLHAHYGPDSYPRQWDAFEIVALAKERGLRAIVLKNHWAETAGLAYLLRKYDAQGIEVFGAVTLDTPVGGVNPQAVRYMADVTGDYGRIVWMPTHDSEHEVAYNHDSRPFVRVSRDGVSVAELREAVALGALIEITAGALFREGPGRARVLEAIRAIGPDAFFVGSDSGLVGTPNHTDALVMAARVLRQNDFDERALDVMFKHNPARLLGLPIRGQQ